MLAFYSPFLKTWWAGFFLHNRIDECFHDIHWNKQLFICSSIRVYSKDSNLPWKIFQNVLFMGIFVGTGDYWDSLYLSWSSIIPDNHLSSCKLLWIRLQSILVLLHRILYAALLQIFRHDVGFFDSNFPSSYNICKPLLHVVQLVLRVPHTRTAIS